MSDMFKNEEKHPSYGTVQFTRTSRGGTCKLFGSSIRQHPSTVKLTVRKASRIHYLHEDRIFGGDEIVEVELSAAQFAELLTTMNMGTGSPCTIRFQTGVGTIEDPPDGEIEIERVQSSFREGLAEIKKWVKDRQAELEERLSKKHLSKDDREFVSWTIGKIVQHVESNWPFVVDQFSEATERVVTAAKSELDAFITTVAQQTGLEQLREMSKSLGAPELKRLPVREPVKGDADDA